jgi:hypothetical protein
VIAKISGIAAIEIVVSIECKSMSPTGRERRFAAESGQL